MKTKLLLGENDIDKTKINDFLLDIKDKLHVYYTIFTQNQYKWTLYLGYVEDSFVILDEKASWHVLAQRRPNDREEFLHLLIRIK